MTQKRFIAANGLDGNSKSIINVTDPTNAQDVATKAYSTNASNLASGTVDPARIANVIAAGASGLMTGSDKTKLDGIATGATANTGTVTTVSVVSANGLAGTVATAGVTPAITLSTTITGLLKGNGTAISAATAGTDYAAPATTLSGYGITDAYTKTEIDSVVQGLDPKQSVKWATTAAGTLATSFANGSAMDGFAIVTGERILIKNQTTASENGIYTVNATGAPTRALDMNAWTEVPNAYVFVEGGATQADIGYVCTAGQTGTIDSTAITWVQFTSAGSYTGSTGITVSGNAISITNTAVTPTSYGSASSVGTFTVNQQGQLTTAASTAIALDASTGITSGTLAAARMPALTGDISTTVGTIGTTLATVNSNVGSFTFASITVNAKGLITAASSGTIPSGSISVTGGDFTLSGTTGTAITNGTLATVNSNVTAVGSTSVVPVITANAKGLVTSITSATITPAAIGALPTLTHGTIGSATLTTTATTAAQILDSNAIATYRSAKYEIQITSSGSYQVCEALVIHDGTNASIVEYGNVNIGTLTTSLATFDANVSGGDMNLVVTPAQATSTVFKVIKTLVNI